MPNIGIIDFATSPPVGILTPRLDHNGPFGPGNHMFTSWDDNGTSRNVSDTYGVIVQFNGAIPPKLGLVPGFDDGGLIVADEFDMRLVQLVAMHQLLTGPWAITQLDDLHVLPFMLRWAEALPGRVGIYVLPGIAVDLFYLRAL
jgi:hypothetical protein